MNRTNARLDAIIRGFETDALRSALEEVEAGEHAIADLLALRTQLDALSGVLEDLASDLLSDLIELVAEDDRDHLCEIVTNLVERGTLDARLCDLSYIADQWSDDSAHRFTVATGFLQKYATDVR